MLERHLGPARMVDGFFKRPLAPPFLFAPSSFQLAIVS